MKQISIQEIGGLLLFIFISAIVGSIIYSTLAPRVSEGPFAWLFEFVFSVRQLMAILLLIGLLFWATERIQQHLL